MFQELMPLLAQRILLITLSRVSDEQISVNIIPKPLKSDHQDDGSALTTPLRVTGTPKELDEQLPPQLAEFVETHLGPGNQPGSQRTRSRTADPANLRLRTRRKCRQRPARKKPRMGHSRVPNHATAPLKPKALG
jgi:PRTRC genetic system protein E